MAKGRKRTTSTTAKPETGGHRTTPASSTAAQHLSSRRADLLCFLALFVGTFLLYVPSLFNDFVEYDDEAYVARNLIVQKGLTWEGVKWAFTTGYFSNWLPVTWLTHMLDVQLWGLRAGGHHATSALLHAANAAMVYLLVRRATLCGAGRALAVALLFAAHPLRVESVSWVAERKDVLAATFFLLSLLAYVKYTRTRSAGRYWLAVLVDALGLMSKTMLVTVPGVLLLLDYWPLRRMPVSPLSDGVLDGDSAASQEPPRSLRWLLLEKVPFAALTVIASLWTYELQKLGGAMQFLSHLTLRQRIDNALVSVPRYLWKIVRPIDLSVYYPHPGDWPAWAVVSSAGLIVLLSGLTIWQVRRRPWLAVGWFWFLGMLVPVCGIIQVGSQSMADRYTYLPGIGLTIALVWSVAELARRVPRVRPLLKPVTAAVAGILAVATVFQQRYWDNTTDLFEHALVVDERNWLAHLFAGAYYQANGDHVTALKELDRSLELEPTAYEIYPRLAFSLLGGLNRPDELIARCRRGLALDPNLTSARLWLGIALEQKGELNAAAEQLAEVARRTPWDANARAEYGNVLVKLGRYDEAAVELSEALRRQPDHDLALKALADMRRKAPVVTQPAGAPR